HATSRMFEQPCAALCNSCHHGAVHHTGTCPGPAAATTRSAMTQEDIMRRRTFLGTTAAMGGLGLLAACAPGSDGGGDSAAPAPAADEVDTDVAALGDLTLTVWDQEVRGAQNDAIEALIGSFEEKYPNVTVERTKQSFDDLQQQTGLALSGNDVPDVLQVNNARGDMGAFVADGL